MKTARTVLIVLLALLSAAPRAFAGQQHIVSPNTIATTTAARVAAQDADRAAIRDALARPEVRSAAAAMGVDTDRLDAFVGTMTGADLEQVASTARQVNDQLVGGASTVTFSTTTIIIVLLLIILLIVAIR